MIALPCQSTVMASTAFSLVHAVRNVPFNVDMVIRKGCDIVGSRTWLVTKAIEAKATHILFVDSDMYFPPVKHEDGRMMSPIQKLLEEDKDIIGAPYNFRQLPQKSTATPLDADADLTKPYKVSSIGTGFLLVKTDVFWKRGTGKNEDEWFLFGRKEDGELIFGEDAWFCRNAIKRGYDVWCDPTLGIKHIGEYLY